MIIYGIFRHVLQIYEVNSLNDIDCYKCIMKATVIKLNKKEYMINLIGRDSGIYLFTTKIPIDVGKYEKIDKKLSYNSNLQLIDSYTNEEFDGIYDILKNWYN